MLYGLGTFARDLERARQEAYRNSIRAAGVDDQAATKAVKKLPGIGERQPSKDDLELALIRCAFPSQASHLVRACDKYTGNDADCSWWFCLRTDYRCRLAACS
jgi:hypothetical protein